MYRTFYDDKRYPLQTAEIGCFDTGVHVLSDDYTQVLGIPWLTVIQDVYSGYILGFHLSMEAPNLRTMALTFQNMIEVKDWIREYERITYDWLAFGIPKTIICPKKYNVSPICEALDIILDQNITRRMNRWAKTLQDDFFSRFPGNVHITKIDKRFKPEKKANLTIGNLKELIVVYILGVHHNQWSMSFYGAPNEIFNEGIKLHPLREPRDALWREKLAQFTKPKSEGRHQNANDL